MLFGYDNQETFAKLCGWSQQKMSKLERVEVSHLNYEPTFTQDGSSEKIIDALTTLTKTVADLAAQVAELKSSK